MQSNMLFRLILFSMLSSFTRGEPSRRIALVEANGPMARAFGIAALAENQITDGVTAKLAGQSGLTLVDRASIEKIIKEQNIQNSDRFSADTAVRIGKLLGVGQMGLVNVYDLSYTTHPETSGKNTRTMGTTVVRANIRLVDVETAAILSEPAAAFQESVVISEATQPKQFGQMRFPSKQISSGDPVAIQQNEWAKARESVTTELANKLMKAIGSVPAMKMPSALVAGIANGGVFINQGRTSGVSVGSKFQVVREVSVGLNDPTTGKPILEKKHICVLTIASAEETHASGACPGGLPQASDVAMPMTP